MNRFAPWTHFHSIQSAAKYSKPSFIQLCWKMPGMFCMFWCRYVLPSNGNNWVFLQIVVQFGFGQRFDRGQSAYFYYTKAHWKSCLCNTKMREELSPPHLSLSGRKEAFQPSCIQLLLQNLFSIIRKVTLHFCCNPNHIARRIYFQTYHLVHGMANIKLAPQRIPYFRIPSVSPKCIRHKRTSFSWHLTCNIIYYCGLFLKLIYIKYELNVFDHSMSYC